MFKEYSLRFSVPEFIGRPKSDYKDIETDLFITFMKLHKNKNTREGESKRAASAFIIHSEIPRALPKNDVNHIPVNKETKAWGIKICSMYLNLKYLLCK